MAVPKLSEVISFGSNYSPTKLFDKISKVAKKAGVKAVYAALILYYAIMDDEVPLKDKAVVIGALGYFICPVDFIPDVLGPLGYSDDISVLIMALKTIWGNISYRTKSQARSRMESWFGRVSDSELHLF